MIVGTGIDAVDVASFGARLARAPALAERLFAPEELGLSSESLAARWAAKEAFVKATGGIGRLAWRDIAVSRERGSRPQLIVRDAIREHLRERGIDRVHVSLTHERGERPLALALVIAERDALPSDGERRA